MSLDIFSSKEDAAAENLRPSEDFFFTSANIVTFVSSAVGKFKIVSSSLCIR